MMAQYSIPFCVALAHFRDPRDPRSFDETALGDPQIRALTERITMTVAKERPTPLAAEVIVSAAGRPPAAAPGRPTSRARPAVRSTGTSCATSFCSRRGTAAARTWR